MELNFELLASHTRMERAMMLARLSLADFVNDRHGLTEKVAYRIADALEKYEILDSREWARNMPISNPLFDLPSQDETHEEPK